MNFARKLVIIYAVIFCSRLFSSCCNCEDPMEYRYTDTAIRFSNLDNSGEQPVLARLESVPKAAFGIRLEILSIESAHIPAAWGFPGAYALSCRCKSVVYEPKASIQSIEIITLTPFDGLPANSDVTDKFKAYGYFAFQSVASYAAQASPVRYNTLSDPRGTDFLLMEPPLNPGAFQFEMRIHLSDGETLVHQTPSLNLI